MYSVAGWMFDFDKRVATRKDGKVSCAIKVIGDKNVVMYQDWQTRSEVTGHSNSCWARTAYLDHQDMNQVDQAYLSHVAEKVLLK